jgi:hypothetical protein
MAVDAGPCPVRKQSQELRHWRGKEVATQDVLFLGRPRGPLVNEGTADTDVLDPACTPRQLAVDLDLVVGDQNPLQCDSTQKLSSEIQR